MLSYNCQRFALIVIFQSNDDTSHSIHPSIIHPSIRLFIIHPFLDTRHYYRCSKEENEQKFLPWELQFIELCMVAIGN